MKKRRGTFKPETRIRHCKKLSDLITGGRTVVFTTWAGDEQVRWDVVLTNNQGTITVNEKGNIAYWQSADKLDVISLSKNEECLGKKYCEMVDRRLRYLSDYQTERRRRDRAKMARAKSHLLPNSGIEQSLGEKQH